MRSSDWAKAWGRVPSPPPAPPDPGGAAGHCGGAGLPLPTTPVLHQPHACSRDAWSWRFLFKVKPALWIAGSPVCPHGKRLTQTRARGRPECGAPSLGARAPGLFRWAAWARSWGRRRRGPPERGVLPGWATARGGREALTPSRVDRCRGRRRTDVSLTHTHCRNQSHAAPHRVTSLRFVPRPRATWPHTCSVNTCLSVVRCEGRPTAYLWSHC